MSEKLCNSGTEYHITKKKKKGISEYYAIDLTIDR